MIELPFVFMSGLLGSAHCLGMCGPFAIAIGSGTRSWKQNLWRQSCYTVGRVFTYGFLGALAAFGGATLSRQAAVWVRVPAVLSIVAGLFLIYQGLSTAGVFQAWSRGKASSGTACLAASFFASFLRAPAARQVFIAGMLTGFLPCGLVYAMLALAASSSSLWQGIVTMALFGLGTSPVMMLTGWGGSLLHWTWRQRMLKIAAWCVVVAGVLSVVRGAGFLPMQAEAKPHCPFCAPE